MPSDAVPARDRGGLVAVLLAGLATQALATWAVLALPSVAPKAADSLGVDVVLIGYHVSLIYTLATLSSVFAGALVISWGACRTSQVALLGSSLGCVVIAAVPSFATAVVGAMLIGFCYALTNPSAAALLARNVGPRNRGLVFSLKQAGVPVGGIAAGLVTPAIAVVHGWQVAVASTAAVGVVLALLLVPFRPSWDAMRAPVAGIRSDTIAGLRRVVSTPALVFLCGFGFLFAGIQLTIMTFAVAMAVEELGFQPLVAGALLATIQAAGFAGRLFWGAVADRIGSNVRALAIIATIATAGCLGLAGVAEGGPAWPVFLVCGLLGASAISWNGVFMSEIVRHSDAGSVGTTTGVSMVFVFAGVILGPAIFVSLHGWLGSYTTAFGVLAVPTLIGGLAIVAGPRLLATSSPRRGPPHDPTLADARDPQPARQPSAADAPHRRGT